MWRERVQHWTFSAAHTEALYCLCIQQNPHSACKVWSHTRHTSWKQFKNKFSQWIAGGTTLQNLFWLGAQTCWNISPKRMIKALLETLVVVWLVSGQSLITLMFYEGICLTVCVYIAYVTTSWHSHFLFQVVSQVQVFFHPETDWRESTAYTEL